MLIKECFILLFATKFWKSGIYFTFTPISVWTSHISRGQNHTLPMDTLLTVQPQGVTLSYFLFCLRASPLKWCFLGERLSCHLDSTLLPARWKFFFIHFQGLSWCSYTVVKIWTNCLARLQLLPLCYHQPPHASSVIPRLTTASAFPFLLNLGALTISLAFLLALLKRIVE